MEEVRRGVGPAMSRRDRKRVLIGLAVLVFVLFVAGIFAAYNSRNDTICSDGQPPAWQHKGVGFGQIEYLCHDGERVTK